MGIAKARDIKGEDHHVIPVIGDGALTGGMALEALNHIGSDRTNMTIILNDNEMSIAPNVGAMHNMLGRMRTNTQYNHLLRSDIGPCNEKEIKNWFHRLRISRMNLSR